MTVTDVIFQFPETFRRGDGQIQQIPKTHRFRSKIRSR
jgi:hypothetical protein